MNVEVSANINDNAAHSNERRTEKNHTHPQIKHIAFDWNSSTFFPFRDVKRSFNVCKWHFELTNKEHVFFLVSPRKMLISISIDFIQIDSAWQIHVMWCELFCVFSSVAVERWDYVSVLFHSSRWIFHRIGKLSMQRKSSICLFVTHCAFTWFYIPAEANILIFL